jgi:hypothetical protein
MVTVFITVYRLILQHGPFIAVLIGRMPVQEPVLAADRARMIAARASSHLAFRLGFGRIGMVETKTNCLNKTKIIFQKTHPRDGFSLMTGTAPLPSECLLTSSLTVTIP